MTEIQQQPMTRPEAERATERIRLALDRVSSAWVDLGERIADAYRRRADLALGYTQHGPCSLPAWPWVAPAVVLKAA